MAFLLYADGHADRVFLADGQSGFSLRELQRFVGGYIEIVRAPSVLFKGEQEQERMYLVLNEDGKRLGLPRNGVATELYHLAGGLLLDAIVGNVLFASAVEIGENTDDES